MFRLDFFDFFEMILRCCLIVAVCVGVILISCAIYLSASSTGRVDYCQVEGTLGGYTIRGHRNWRPDVIIAVASNVQDAESIRKITCP